MSFLIVFRPEKSEHKNVSFWTVLISTPVINKAETFRLIAHNATIWTNKLYFTEKVFWVLAIPFQENEFCRSFLLCLTSLLLQFSLFYSSCLLFCPSLPCLITTFALPVLSLLSCLHLFPHPRCPAAVPNPLRDWSLPKGGGIFVESAKLTKGNALSSLKSLIQICLLWHAYETLGSWVLYLPWVSSPVVQKCLAVPCHSFTSLYLLIASHH